MQRWYQRSSCSSLLLKENSAAVRVTLCLYQIEAPRGHVRASLNGVGDARLVRSGWCALCVRTGWWVQAAPC